MRAHLFSTPEALAQINMGTSYLEGLHNGKRPSPPGISIEHMEAAMKVWIDTRKHLLNNINADFKDIKAASAAGKPIGLLRAQLAGRVEAYNGIYLPHFMESPEAATGATPLEGWLFSSPPRQWRAAKKAAMPLKPIDDPRCFFTPKPTVYMRIMESVLAIDPDSIMISSLINSSLTLSIFAVSGQEHPGFLIAGALLFAAAAVAYMARCRRSKQND